MLKVLMATAVPPPDHGGICSWTSSIQRGFKDIPDIALTFIDTKVRFRSVVNPSRLARLVYGTIQAIHTIWKVRQHFEHDRPDVFHLCTSAGPAAIKDLLLARMARARSIPCILHYHMGRLPDIVDSNGKEWKLIRKAMSLASASVVLDGKSKDAVKKELPDVDIVQLPNMIDAEAIDSICDSRQECHEKTQDDLTRLVFVGHVVPAKGVRELVAACAKTQHHRVVLDIIGPFMPSIERELLMISQVAGNGKWLQLHGARDRNSTIAKIAAADIFVLPTYTEGMPYVVLETMACGKPIVTTPVGAIPEMLDINGPQQCGLCVPPRDVDNLATAIVQLIADRNLQKELGQRGRERVKQFYSIAVGCKQLFDLWQRIGAASSNHRCQ